MIILKSKHEKIVQDLVNEIADYQKLLYYRAIAEQITMGEGVIVRQHSEYISDPINCRYVLRCVMFDFNNGTSEKLEVCEFPTQYEANELKDKILSDDNLQRVLSELRCISQVAYHSPINYEDLNKKIFRYSVLFRRWTKRITKFVNETKVQR